MRHLADIANIEYSQIAKIESGQINTTISTAYALSIALGVPLSKLFKFDLKEFVKKSKNARNS